MVRLPLTADEVERGQLLGTLLRRARTDRSIFAVAVAADISPETLRKIETGRIATPAFSTIAAIAGVLGLSLDEVWSAINPAPEAPSGELVSDQQRDRLAS
ncbi:MAG: helix-turn-helix transcriptional regulator [Specibacter sp.]